MCTCRFGGMRYDWSEAFLRKRKTGTFTSLMQTVRANAVAQKTKMARPPESGKVWSPFQARACQG